MTPPDALSLASARLAAGDPPGPGAEEMLGRLEREWQRLEEALALPYGDLAADVASSLRHELVTVLVDAWRARDVDLRRLDREREAKPGWFQRPEMIGYAAYVDRFAGTIRGVGERLGYLEELGVRYLHLMPLLKTRSGPSDGGYAVSDYRAVEPALGSMDDLRGLAAELRSRGISLCVDLVMNHVAVEHDWARRAATGDPDASAMFHIFPDREWPDRYEATLPEVFPTFAPGSFSRLADGRWVWTTFNDYQWDLNWSNPRVFVEMLDILLFLANVGVEVVRLDAVAFLWKRLGTNCQNQPEAHALLSALHACTRIAAPAVAHLAEAIVGPDDLISYLGSAGRPESDLAYHNSLMVQYWAALATADTGLATETLTRFPDHSPSAAWATYIRCHDDIGWAVTDELANAVGIADAGAHRRWLADYYAGLEEGSFARGAHFQENEATGDRRTSGTAASLAGLELALAQDDADALDLAVRRIVLGHALIYGYDGLPMLWMGDEIGLHNDHTYRADPRKAGDNRWMHRPPMDWQAAERRHEPGSVEALLFVALHELGSCRAALPQLHAAVPLEVVDIGDRRLLTFVRRDRENGPLLAIHSFSPAPVELPAGRLPPWLGATARERRTGRQVAAQQPLTIPGYEVLWLTADG